MRKVVVDMDLSRESIRAGIKEIREFQKWLNIVSGDLTQRLAQEGYNVAAINFASVTPLYDSRSGYADVDLNVRFIGKHKAAIRASGKDVCFIEFGAGVTMGQGYPGERPSGVVGIGDYGKKQGGNEKGWWFTDNTKKSVHTYGNPPAAAMFDAQQTICRRVEAIAKEVFRV